MVCSSRWFEIYCAGARLEVGVEEGELESGEIIGVNRDSLLTRLMVVYWDDVAKELGGLV